MTNFIPVFPLRIVVYPGETLNLHVFEPRYKQMIRECLDQKRPFGIPPVLEKNIDPLGTLLEITGLVKEYEDGSMDIHTRGVSVFRVLQFIENIPEKLYSGAIVTYPENTLELGNSAVSDRIVEDLERLYNLLHAKEKFPSGKLAMLSYEIAHYAGLSLEQEYELLGLFSELQRLEYIRRHLNAFIPVMKELEQVQERIQRNGHFRNLSLDDL